MSFKNPLILTAAALAVLAGAATLSHAEDKNDGGGWHHGEGYGKRGGHVPDYLAELDKNADGIISKEEYEAGMADNFKKNDKSGKGLSRTDVEAMVRVQLEKQVQRMTDGIYKYTDKNADGVISKDEWEASQKSRFDRLDKNHDGKIDKDELTHRGRRHHGEGRGYKADEPTATPATKSK